MESIIDRLRDKLAITKLVGTAPAFLKALGHLPAVAKSEATVLLQGETGTGKELVAREVHYLSPRAGQPFVPVNCGSLPDTLLEDELFGHERGAFTDAHLRRPGLIAEAEKGTLFLDEIDTLPRKAQVSLLRVLQEGKYRAVGSSHEQQANVRVVVATNASLDQMVRAGTFRADLFYRLCVFCLLLPPLRERREDILPLASHFLKKHTPADRPGLHLTPDAQRALLGHDWPGNVRELENAILRGSQLSETEAIGVGDLGLPAAAATQPLPTDASFKALKHRSIEAFEREYLLRLMHEHQGNVSQAARAAVKERRDLGKLLKKHRIDPRTFQLSPPHAQS